MTEKLLVGALLVTHGRLGEELLEATRKIVGEIPHMAAVSLGWNDPVEAATKKIEEAMRRIELGKGVILLTDMFGGTPSNIALPLLRRDRLEIVTGVNLPMVIKLANQTGQETLSELARKVRDQGQRHISIASELLEQ